MAATVIAGDATGIFRTLTVDKGSSSGLRKDMAVIAPAGVVGRIVEPPPLYAAKVQLLIDKEAGAGAIIERTGVGGIVVGQDRAGEPPLEMQFVSNLSDAKVGDRVVTSGLDSIFPRGITIGTIAKVEKGSSLYKRITVTPAVDFAEVAAVLVVLDPPADGRAVTDGRNAPERGDGDSAGTGLAAASDAAGHDGSRGGTGAGKCASASIGDARGWAARRAAPDDAASGRAATHACAEQFDPGAHAGPAAGADAAARAGTHAACRRAAIPSPAARGAPMKGATVGLAIIAALALQTSPFFGRNGAGIDLVLVVVVWAALQFGPAAGLMTGAAAGLAQDVLSAGIIGVGGFSKTLVGFGAGVVGSQFIVASAGTRFVVLVVGAAINELVFLGLYAAIERRGFDMPWRQAGARALTTAVVGIVLMIASNAIPAFLTRRRLRRGY